MYLVSILGPKGESMLEQKVTQVRSMGFDEVISATSF